MTTEPYAAAAGLVERSAAAYASAVPTAPEDDGFFGPASVTWRVSADLSAPVAGLRSLLLQALHPLAMAGVDQHSDWRTDPVGRLAATSAYEATVTFGDQESARRVAQRVRAIHEHVRGVDTVTGQPYAAGDPALLLWVHAALVDSGLAASALFGTPLTDADADAYVSRDDRRRRTARRAARDDPGQRGHPRGVHRRRPSRVAPHARGRGVDGLPAGPARPGRGHRRALAGHQGRRGRGAARLGSPDVRLPRAAAADGRRGGPRSARPSACSTRSSWPNPACSRPGSGWRCGCVRWERREIHQARRCRGGERRVDRGPGGGPAPGGQARAWQLAGRAWPDGAPAGGARRRAVREQRAPALRERRASTGKRCGTTWRCRPPRTSPPPWGR